MMIIKAEIIGALYQVEPTYGRLCLCALCGMKVWRRGGRRRRKKSRVGTSDEDLDMVDDYVVCCVLCPGRRRREWKRVHVHLH